MASLLGVEQELQSSDGLGRRYARRLVEIDPAVDLDPGRTLLSGSIVLGGSVATRPVMYIDIYSRGEDSMKVIPRLPSGAMLIDGKYVNTPAPCLIWPD